MVFRNDFNKRCNMGILKVDLTEQMIVFLFSAYNQCFDVVFNIAFQGVRKVSVDLLGELIDEVRVAGFGYFEMFRDDPADQDRYDIAVKPLNRAALIENIPVHF